jgi:hypothetical protein
MGGRLEPGLEPGTKEKVGTSKAVLRRADGLEVPWLCV